ncbi:MAG: 30S ribosomal protein S6 [Chitinophagaceae bacterium]|nr:30S ribosomal protein S6 [Chitinophagaceae bacterium]
MKKYYETVFILSSDLSEETKTKDTVDKFIKILTDNSADIINVEYWGLKQLAYPIKRKTSGFYNLIEFNASPEIVKTLEIEFRRNEHIIRFLITVLDKYAVEYNAKRKNGNFNKPKEEIKTEPTIENKKQYEDK